MIIESEKTKRVIQEAQTRPAKSGIEKISNTIVHGAMRWYAENALISTRIEYHQDYVNDIIQAAKDDYMLVFLGSHSAWGDILSVAQISKRAIGTVNEHLPKEKRIKGAMAPFAETINPKKGKQGKILDRMFQSVLPILTQNDTYPVYTATRNDQLKRGEEKNGKGFVADMLAMGRDGYCVIDVLPEGSVDSGRKNEKGERKGMQLFQDKAMGNIINISKRIRKSGVLFVPIGIEDGWRFNDPTTRLKLFSDAEAAIAGLALTRKDTRELNISPIRVGKPIRTDEPRIAELITSRDWDELNNQMGFAIAEQLSPSMRGVYTNRETLDKALEIQQLQFDIAKKQNQFEELKTKKTT